MIRIAMRTWVCFFASLTILPGCQMLAPLGGWTKSDGTGIPVEYPKSDTPPVSREGYQANSIAKPIPTNDVRVEPRMNPVYLEKAAKEPIKTEFPVPVEIGIEPVGAKSAPSPAPPGILPRTPEQKTEKQEYASLVMALQFFLDKKHEEAIQHLNVYDKRTQEFLIGLLPIMDIFVRKGLDDMSAQEVAVLNSQLISLLATLRPRSELAIDKMCYCKQVRGFGAYESLPGNHVFLSGNKDRPGELVQLYVELKNFACEMGKDGDYSTKLVCSLELQNGKGERVWGHTYDRKETSHQRRTRLNDFFSNYRFYVPELAAGDYTLTIRIVDETVAGHQRDVSKSMGFRVTPVLNQTTLR